MTKCLWICLWTLCHCRHYLAILIYCISNNNNNNNNNSTEIYRAHSCRIVKRESEAPVVVIFRLWAWYWQNQSRRSWEFFLNGPKVWEDLQLPALDTALKHCQVTSLAFCSSSLASWNTLPDHLCLPSMSLDWFWKHLKTFFLFSWVCCYGHLGNDSR